MAPPLSSHLRLPIPAISTHFPSKDASQANVVRPGIVPVAVIPLGQLRAILFKGTFLQLYAVTIAVLDRTTSLVVAVIFLTALDSLEP